MTWINNLDDLFDSDFNLRPYKNNIQNNLFLDVESCTIHYASAARNGKQNRSIWQPLVELEMKGQTFYIVDRAVIKSLLTGLLDSSIGHRAFMAIYKRMALKETLEYWMTLEGSAKTLTGRFRILTTGHKVITSINTKDIQDSHDLNGCVDLLENLGYTSKIYNYDDNSVKLIATSQYADEIEMEILNNGDTYINGKYNVMQKQHEKDKEVWATNYFIQPTLAKNLNFEDTFKVERVIRDLHAGIEETRKWCPVVYQDEMTDRNYPVLNGYVKHSVRIYNLARHDRNRLMHEMFLDVRGAFKKN
tara:strand:- start:27615 stop:28526 length:912 start_codon:yes stop_codon:yes gene_type:complete